MMKIWFMLVLFSFPNAPSVKYNGYVYSSEGDCEFADRDWETKLT